MAAFDAEEGAAGGGVPERGAFAGEVGEEDEAVGPWAGGGGVGFDEFAGVRGAVVVALAGPFDEAAAEVDGAADDVEV